MQNKINTQFMNFYGELMVGVLDGESLSGVA